MTLTEDLSHTIGMLKRLQLLLGWLRMNETRRAMVQRLQPKYNLWKPLTMTRSELYSVVRNDSLPDIGQLVHRNDSVVIFNSA